MPAVDHHGGCGCGAVRFTARGEPRFVARCHCTSCRRATAAAFSTWVGFTGDAVTWTATNPAYYASSEGVRRGFCPRCGTPLSYEGDQWPGEIHILIGAFDTPEVFVPSSDVFADEALHWVRSDLIR